MGLQTISKINMDPILDLMEKREKWLWENFLYTPDDVLEDENGEFIILIEEEGKRKVYLPEELRR